MFTVYVKHANKSRFSRIHGPIASSLEAITLCLGCIPPGSTSSFQVRKGSVVIWQNEPNTSPKGIEHPVGQNLSLINLRVDRRHVGESCLSVIRHVRKSCKAWKYLPKQIRRGIIQAAITRHKANRDLYIAVMSGNLS